MKKTLIMLLVAVLLAQAVSGCNASRTVGDGVAVSGDAGGSLAEAADGIPNGNTAGDAGGVRTEAGDGLSGGVAEAPSGEGNNSAPGGSGNAKAAVIDDFLGDVKAVTDGKDMPAFKGLALLRRDSLGTGAESWSSLELTEERFILVEENSDVQISQLADEAKNSEITLSAGKIWVIITDKLSDDETFEIKTPTCSLSVRGTVFSVSCNESGGSRVAVYEGTVSFTAKDKNGEEVTFEITRGAAEVIVENGTVTEIRQSELNGGDLTPLQTSGPAGPGGVNNALRTRLTSLEPDMPDGFNAYEYENQYNGVHFRYEGNWGNGKPNGEGTLYMIYPPPEGYSSFFGSPIIAGTFVDGFIHGAATYTEQYYEGNIATGDTMTSFITFDMGRPTSYAGADGIPYDSQWLIDAIDHQAIFGVPPWCWETFP